MNMRNCPAKEKVCRFKGMILPPCDLCDIRIQAGKEVKKK